MQKITPTLWFDGKAEEAAQFYTSVFDNSRITDVQRYGKAGPGEEGSVMLVVFELDGLRYQALNGGPEFTFNEAVSLSVDCASQEEVDRLWSTLTADGGQEGPCGWLKDKYGLSWQIVPRELMTLMADPDPDVSARVAGELFRMKKIDVAALREAARG
ncbi:VOC family protein [Streptomyces sp. ODS28]|uniref:VOC family protein n=1 Tax=Streptomyces sp. ODS28 TaxID=3136688 RepID=UPI0031F01ED2